MDFKHVISTESKLRHMMMMMAYMRQRSIELPCYVPTTVRYYLFSRLLVFLIHSLPNNMR